MLLHFILLPFFVKSDIVLFLIGFKNVFFLNETKIKNKTGNIKRIIINIKKYKSNKIKLIPNINIKL